MQTVNQQQPSAPIISPIQLYQILLSTDYKSLQCVNKEPSPQAQKLTLLKQLKQLHMLKARNKPLQPLLQQLIQTRARLRIKLQELLLQRSQYNIKFLQEMKKLRIQPLQIRKNAKQMEQLKQYKDRNCKMEVRLRELMDYYVLLQKRVEDIQRQNNIIKVQQCYPLLALNPIHTPILSSLPPPSLIPQHPIQLPHLLVSSSPFPSISPHMSTYQSQTSSWRDLILNTKIQNKLYQTTRKNQIKNREKCQSALREIWIQDKINAIDVNIMEKRENRNEKDLEKRRDKLSKMAKERPWWR